jgi:hypothetical protein
MVNAVIGLSFFIDLLKTMLGLQLCSAEDSVKGNRLENGCGCNSIRVILCSRS